MATSSSTRPGNEGLTTRCGDRRLKSAKARSRVKLGTDSQRALWGFQVSAEFDCGEKGVDYELHVGT